MTLLTLLAAAMCVLAAGAAARGMAPARHPRFVTGNWDGTLDGLGVSFALKYSPSNSEYGPSVEPYDFANFVLMEPLENENCSLATGSPQQLVVGENDFTPVYAGGSFHMREEGVPGGLTGARSAKFSIRFDAPNCPRRTVTWRAHPVHRRSVSDGVWRVQFGHGESERITVAAGGRAVSGFAFPSSYTCVSGGDELFIGPEGTAKAQTDGTTIAIQFRRRTARGTLNGTAPNLRCHLAFTAKLIKPRR